MEQASNQASMFGMPMTKPPLPGNYFEDGDLITFGNSTLKVIFVPGHCPGGVAFYSEADKLLVGGDILFCGSVGRTDLPRGDFDILIHSITGKLWPLGEEVTFIPVHGPLSTFGDQRRFNPFVGDDVLSRGA